MADRPELGRSCAARGIGVAWRRRALVRQAKHLAEIAAEVLGRSHLLPVAGGQIEEPVLTEGDAVGEVAVAADLWLLPPDHLEVAQCRALTVRQVERSIAQRGAAGAGRA